MKYFIWNPFVAMVFAIFSFVIVGGSVSAHMEHIKGEQHDIQDR